MEVNLKKIKDYNECYSIYTSRQKLLEGNA